MKMTEVSGTYITPGNLRCCGTNFRFTDNCQTKNFSMKELFEVEVQCNECELVGTMRSFISDENFAEILDKMKLAWPDDKSMCCEVKSSGVEGFLRKQIDENLRSVFC